MTERKARLIFVTVMVLGLLAWVATAGALIHLIIKYW